MTLFRRLTAVLLLAAALVACGNDAATSEDLEFTDVWTRQPADGQSVAAVYGTVTNTGSSDVTITGVAAPVTDRAELHETLEEDGLMTMQERDDGFVVPAGGTFTFEPGGPHVMLFDIDAASYPTDALDVTFSFDAGPDSSATAEVRVIEGGDGHDSHDHDDHGDEHGDHGDEHGDEDKDEHDEHDQSDHDS
ncbi:MAG: copper chaperone PCu(A)C [Actinomycetota bacterium]